MGLEGVNTIEIPSPNYPLYYILDVAPSQADIPSGMTAYDYEKMLTKEDRQHLKDQIKNSGSPHEVVIDIHDNTDHPDVWKNKDVEIYRQRLGYKTEDGLNAARLEQHVGVSFRIAPGKLDQVKSFMLHYKPRPDVKHTLNFREKEDFDRLTSGLEIGVEYWPAIITKWPNKIERLPIKKGLAFLVDFIRYLRNNYE